MKFRCAGVVLLCLLLISGAACKREPSKKPQPEPPLYTSLATMSDFVVVGRVLDSDARWVGGHIVKSSRLEVLETMKGDSVPSSLVVSTLGGTVRNTTEYVTHEPRLEDGETSLLFLKNEKTLVGEDQPNLRIVTVDGRVPLLSAGQRSSRLQRNWRVRRKLDAIAKQVQAAGGGQ